MAAFERIILRYSQVERASMDKSDPDFEAMKDVTRLWWLLDMSPVPAATEHELAIAASASPRDAD